MIIGFEAKRVFQNNSGLGNYSRNTVNMLVKYFQGNKYKLFAPKITDLYTPDSSSVEVVLPPPFWRRYLGSYWRINKVAQLLKSNHIDLFHGFSQILPFGIENTGIPSVVTIHDLIFLRYPGYYKWIDRKIYYFFTLSSCRRATKIIAISNQTKSDLIRFFGIHPDKIEVLYQSCDSRYFEKVDLVLKSSVRQKFNLPERFILCVGTIEKRKNQLAILEAAVNEKLTTTIVILGKATEYINELQQFIQEAGVRKQVIFLHHTTTVELQAIYQMAEVMIYPSFFEGFGLPVLEAQASGCPVITSGISSLPEAGGEGALYIDPKNRSEIGHALKNVLSNNTLKQDLIKRGAANAERFGEKIVAERLMKFYNSLANKSDHAISPDNTRFLEVVN